MRNYEIETKWTKNANYKGKSYEKGEKIVLDRGEHERLYNKGFVEEGKIINSIELEDEE